MTAGVMSLSVHGPLGVLDLHLAATASGREVAREYARQAGLAAPPVLHTRLGRPLPPDLPLAQVGVVTGALLLALPGSDGPPVPGSRPAGGRRPDAAEPGLPAALVCAMAVLCAWVAGWLAAQQPESSDVSDWAVGLLLGAAVVAVLPVGRRAGHRTQAAPAFAGAAALVVAESSAQPEQWSTVVGAAALAAALVAVVGAVLARARHRPGREGLRVWIVAGVAVFAATTSTASVGVGDQVVWALLLVVASLAARFVPMVVVAVPESDLVDLEALTLTAWPAHDPRPGTQTGAGDGVTAAAAADVAERATRTVNAACLAVLVVCSISAVLLLCEATVPIDRIGARLEVGLAGAVLLLGSGRHRHRTARAALRAAGLACWTALVTVLVADAGSRPLLSLAVGSVGLGGVLVVVAVALGRGWRSAWWSRRAEVAESWCGAAALGSVVVAAGFLPVLWKAMG